MCPRGAMIFRCSQHTKLPYVRVFFFFFLSERYYVLYNSICPVRHCPCQFNSLLLLTISKQNV